MGNYNSLDTYRTDPTGRLNLYDSSAVPSIEEAVDQVYAYVQFRASELGLSIKKNRGVPKKANPANMLTDQEKALYILGRATGVAYKEILARVQALRESEGRSLGDSRSFFTAGERVLARHRPIVQAIQADMIAAAEAFSPLVGGAQRFSWRAQMLEHYRQRMIAISQDKSLEDRERDDAIRLIDIAMRPHLKWFDSLNVSKDMMGKLANPSQRAAEQSQRKAEADIQAQFEAGTITDSERISRLRKLKHGD